jgi:hypothetical protein
MDPTNPNNVPSLPPGTLPSEPMAAPPASPKAAEDELDVALNGQEPTVKNLILAAIGVMKVREPVVLRLLCRSSITALDYAFVHNNEFPSHFDFCFRIAKPGPTANGSATGSTGDTVAVSTRSKKSWRDLFESGS